MNPILNLANIPAPTLIETLDYETILADKLLKLHQLLPDYQALESDPAYKLLEIFSYDELLLRQRVNDAARGIMLAFAVGSDLEQLAARYDITRLDGESDNRLRSRIQQGYYTLAAAGPSNAYKQHALSISTDINDVSVISEAAGQVSVTVFAKQIIEQSIATEDETSHGTVVFDQSELASSQIAIIARNDSEIMDTIRLKLNANDVRPLTDHVIVKSPVLVPFTVSATLTVYRGPDPVVVEADAKKRLNDYLISIRKLGFDATRSGIIGALTAAGVQNVALINPNHDISLKPTELAIPLSTNISVGGIDD